VLTKEAHRCTATKKYWPFYGAINIDGFVKSLEPRLVKLFRTVGANNHSPAKRANDYSPLQRTRRESGDKSRLYETINIDKL